jgi:putative ABC transport system permease protein
VSLRFVSAMVRRESRASVRRFGLHTLSIAVGVAALVAINSFRADVESSIRSQARTLFGADLELHRNQAFPDSVRRVLDSVAATGVPVSYATSFASMALAPRSGLTRLVQVRAAQGGFPYYGGVETEPAGLWPAALGGSSALVDAAVLIQLDVAVGDTLRVGDVAFVIAGAVTRYPGRVSLESAIGPRVYIPLAQLEATHLIRRGSRAFYEATLKLDDPNVVRRFLYRYRHLFAREQVRSDTVDEAEDDLTSALDTLARFLGLVGLAALLLGGVGVASAVHVYVKSRLESVAVLRCLGARQRAVFTIYLAQAVALGLVGAAIGAALGLGVQALLPRILGEFLPLDVVPRLHPPAIAAGLGLGVLVAVAFALLPLLAVRSVPPLRAIRRETAEPNRRPDPWRIAAATVLGGVTVAVCVWQAPARGIGLGFAAAIAVTTVALWVTAAVLIQATRRFFPHRASYAVRQGVANLFRPGNQTLAVTLALGFGVFLIGGLYVAQQTILRQLRVDARPDRPNLVLFDAQTDQQAGVRALLERHGLPILQQTPLVPARIHAINDRTVDEILKSPDGYRYERWALRREYRNTYRDTVVGSEEIVAGSWFGDTAGGKGNTAGAEGQREAGGARADSLPEISVEEDVAAGLLLKLGDRVTWDVQGVPITTRVTSLRRVRWMRFEPNFFVVFQPGVLETAPQMLVMMTRVADPTLRARVQRDLVIRFPNVGVLDLTLVQQTVDTVVRRVTLAIRFMAFFSMASGVLILIGALATSRLQRQREAVLLRTLGATAARIRAILFTEYAALGLLGGVAGTALAAAGGWAAARWIFEMPYHPPLAALVGCWVASAALAVLVGGATSRDLTRKAPLEALRALAE